MTEIKTMGELGDRLCEYCEGEEECPFTPGNPYTVEHCHEAYATYVYKMDLIFFQFGVKGL